MGEVECYGEVVVMGRVQLQGGFSFREDGKGELDSGALNLLASLL